MVKLHFYDCWEKVSPNEWDVPGKLHKVLKGQYEQHSHWVIDGWESEKQFVTERAKNNDRYEGIKTVTVDGKQITGHYFKGQSFWGINSFQIMTVEESTNA